MPLAHVFADQVLCALHQRHDRTSAVRPVMRSGAELVDGVAQRCRHAGQVLLGGRCAAHAVHELCSRHKNHCSGEAFAFLADHLRSPFQQDQSSVVLGRVEQLPDQSLEPAVPGARAGAARGLPKPGCRRDQGAV